MRLRSQNSPIPKEALVDEEDLKSIHQTILQYELRTHQFYRIQI